jgi:hypothetical protein
VLNLETSNLNIKTAMADDNGVVELEVFVESGKTTIMVLNIDRTRILRENWMKLHNKSKCEWCYGCDG